MDIRRNGVISMVVIVSLCHLLFASADDDNKVSHIPTLCEVCRVFVYEMDKKMAETYSKQTLDLSSKPFSPDARKVDFSRSELRLLTVLETACEEVSDYAVQDKDGMQRYAKQPSETLSTLQGLRGRGVKVDIGMPWEVVEKQPNKEIASLKRQCEALAEEYEDDLSAWYFQHQEEPLVDYFCRNTVLKGKDQTCLALPWQPLGLPYSDGSGGPKKETGPKKRVEL
ncbi:hypothetical protein RvY_10355 [Ramazzottius varieornatus]|uniref:DUF3456 domain-containing protein n=1 Tax=Ramazzottius varieornatus TaxID=947166 RepID=A0A1D1VEY3_RAMVA|nr:hypothetical protein RvY_10355 [Ramazzottius varieornatus]